MAEPSRHNPDAGHCEASDAELTGVAAVTDVHADGLQPAAVAAAGRGGRTGDRQGRVEIRAHVLAAWSDGGGGALPRASWRADPLVFALCESGSDG